MRRENQLNIKRQIWIESLRKKTEFFKSWIISRFRKRKKEGESDRQGGDINISNSTTEKEWTNFLKD